MRYFDEHSTKVYMNFIKFRSFVVFQSGNGDFPDLEFSYSDTDTHINEIAELYSYTEHPEFQHNVKGGCFCSIGKN